MTKSRSLGQIFVKVCYHCRGHNFDPILIKLAQNIYIGDISDKFEYGWSQVKSNPNPNPNLFIAQNANIHHISDKLEYGWGRVEK